MNYLNRFLSNSSAKGQINYINTQKKIEVLRTVIYFGISLAIFFMGLFTTKSRLNLLTIVAVLGCLPASKALVEAILYLKFSSCTEENSKLILDMNLKIDNGFDFVFTSYSQNFVVSHIAIVGNTICGFSEDKNFKEQDFYKHIDKLLKLDNFNNTSIKIFTDINKYLKRLEELNMLTDSNKDLTTGIMNTLKSVSL